MLKCGVETCWSSPTRLLLWDCDDRTYSYYIDVSADQNHWTRVVDKSKEATRWVCCQQGWQHRWSLFIV